MRAEDMEDIPVPMRRHVPAVPPTTTSAGPGAQSTPVTPARVAARRTGAATDTALVAAFTALIAAVTYIGAIPVGSAGVPITLQTMGVALTGCVLGPVRGFLSAALYLALGASGLPVFAEHSGGLAVFTGPSAGYLYAFPLAAAAAGFLTTLLRPGQRMRAAWVVVPALASSVVVIHPVGIVGMKLYFDVPWQTALTYDMPFWVGDILKTTIVALVAAEVHRAFPQLFDHR